MKRHVVMTLMVCILALTAGCRKKEPAPVSQTESLLLENAKKAAPLEGLTFIKGGPVTLETGKVFVVEFWATWCPPCRQSIPHLTGLQNELKDKGVTVIGISSEVVNTVKPFVETMGTKMDYAVAVDIKGSVNAGYMEAYKQRGIPTAFIVDASGDVVWVGHPMGDLDAALKQVLAQTPPSEIAVEEIAATPISAAAKPPSTPEPEKKEPTAAQTGNKAAALDELTYIKGEPVTFKEGNVYVVEFWATWCGPCLQSIPHLTEIQSHYKDKGVTVIGITNESDLDTVKKFVNEKGDTMNYTVAQDPKGKALDGYMTAYKQRGIPTAFIIDASGNVAWVGHPMDGMDEVLEQVIAGDFDADAYAKFKAERKEQRLRFVKLYTEYVQGLMNGESKDTLEPIAQQLLASDNPEHLNSLSWTLLTADQQAQRDVKTALTFAEKAVELTKSENPGILDTYALALFENGQYAEAVKNQTKALQIMTDKGYNIPADMKQRLEQFKKKLTELAI